MVLRVRVTPEVEAGVRKLARHEEISISEVGALALQSAIDRGTTL